MAHLRRELDAANASETELRATLASVRSELAEAPATTESLKTQNLGLQRRQVQRDQEKDGSDPLAEQVRFQLEALVKEKAELARENDALWRENESLQELLMHSNMASTAEAMYSPGGALADLVPQPDFSEADAEMTETKAEDTVEAVPEATETNEVEASEAKAEDTVEATETEAKTEIASEAPLEAKAEPVFETLEVIDAAAAPDAEMETRDAPVEEAEAAVAEAAAAPPRGGGVERIVGGDGSGGCVRPPPPPPPSPPPLRNRPKARRARRASAERSDATRARSSFVPFHPRRRIVPSLALRALRRTRCAWRARCFARAPYVSESRRVYSAHIMFGCVEVVRVESIRGRAPRRRTPPRPPLALVPRVHSTHRPTRRGGAHTSNGDLRSLHLDSARVPPSSTAFSVRRRRRFRASGLVRVRDGTAAKKIPFRRPRTPRAAPRNAEPARRAW